MLTPKSLSSGNRLEPPRLSSLCWNGRLLIIFAIGGIALSGPQVRGAEGDSRIADRFDPAGWHVVGGSDSSRSLAAGENGGLGVDLAFSGDGLQTYRLEPLVPIAAPGTLKRVSFAAGMSSPGVGIKVNVTDGYGRSSDLDVRGPIPGESSTVYVEIPEDMVQPIAIRGLVLHNWGTRFKNTSVQVTLSDLELQIDASSADPATGRYLAWKPDPGVKPDGEREPLTPWVMVEFSSVSPGHFFAGRKPVLSLTVRNWKSEQARLTAELEVKDEAGKAVWQDTKQFDVETTAQLRWEPPLEKFGPYSATLKLRNGEAAPEKYDLRFAIAPKPRELSAEAKMASPYGMNSHAGVGLLLPPFREAGVVWFRDYMFTRDRLERAKGNDRNFLGWPNFPDIVQAYADAGAILMPVLGKSIPRPTVEDGEVKGNEPPDRKWIADLATVILAFPSIKYWELDNEYDLNVGAREAEEILKWAHYGNYHEKFGEAVEFLGQGELVAVENGAAGVYPKRVAELVDAGAFDHIGVVNGHHSCGVEAPEENVANYNTRGGDTGLFYDELRDLVKAAHKDGKAREVFLSEFGWDTLAGQVVSEAQQAAYLPRAYMMFAAAGVGKSFWFWNFDSATPVALFDGCGMMTAGREPKPSLSAMAGLTSVLPTLDYVGNFNVGPGTLGYVFRQDGNLVAAAFRIHAGETPLEIDFGRGARLRDGYGNALSGTRAMLDILPVYATGIDQESPLMQQAMISVESHEFMATTAGEDGRVVVRIDNPGSDAIRYSLTMKVPEGWTGPKEPIEVTVPAGEHRESPLVLRVPDDERVGISPVTVAVQEIASGKSVKSIPLRVSVREPFRVTVGELSGNPGKTEIPVTVTSRASSKQDLQVSLSLPANWKALSRPQQFMALAPEEKREVSLELEWADTVPGGETAEVVVDSGRTKLAAPIIPPFLPIQAVGGNGWFDGDAAKWPKENRLPDWMLGSSHGEARAGIWLGWSDAGLWGALDVTDSKVYVTDPRSFWRCDTLEIFLDSGNRKDRREIAQGDHQFWLMPQPDDGSVYVGQWKCGKETAATRFGIAGVQGVSQRTETGYRLEFLIPWSEIEGARPKAGSRWGLNLNLRVKGADGDRDVYWPRPPGEEFADHPEWWGTVELVR